MSTRHTRVKSKVILTMPAKKERAKRKAPVVKAAQSLSQKDVVDLPALMQVNQIKPGEVKNPVGAPKGMRLSTRITEILGERSLRKDGRYNTRFDDVADAFVMQMEFGSLPHAKEFMERTEGKVTQPVNLDINAVKLYEDVPTEGPEAP